MALWLENKPYNLNSVTYSDLRINLGIGREVDGKAGDEPIVAVDLFNLAGESKLIVIII